MGLPNYYAEDTQTEEMTGREYQWAFYVRDRWTVNPKLTVSGGAPPRELPADDPRRARHRDGSTTTRYDVIARRPRRTAEGRRHQSQDVVPRAARRRGLPLQREDRAARRLRPDDQPAAVVAADARVVSRSTSTTTRPPPAPTTM